MIDEHYVNLGLKQILENIEQVVDLRITPLEEVMNTVIGMFPNLCLENLENLRKAIMKRKNILKRYHAKNKDRASNLVKKEYYVISDMQLENVDKEDIQAEIKKKRNRMSAQISRDRKKLKIQELEVNNSKLLEETERIKLENEKLK